MEFKLIGKNYTTPDLVAKVTGKAKYAEDFRAEGMLFVKLMLSPRPHARVAQHRRQPPRWRCRACTRVLTADDMPAPPPPPAPPAAPPAPAAQGGAAAASGGAVAPQAGAPAAGATGAPAARAAAPATGTAPPAAAPARAGRSGRRRRRRGAAAGRRRAPPPARGSSR